LKLLSNIFQDAENNDEKAVFLLDIIKNYRLKVPRWSEKSVRLCTVWRFCSAKGYEFCRRHLVKLPSKTTISRYLGPFNDRDELIKERLMGEISILKNPIERICSLIIDDMWVKNLIQQIKCYVM
jgi:hypothetical protein